VPRWQRAMIASYNYFPSLYSPHFPLLLRRIFLLTALQLDVQGIDAKLDPGFLGTAQPITGELTTGTRDGTAGRLDTESFRDPTRRC